MKSSKLMKAIIFWIFILSLPAFSQNSKVILNQLKKEYQKLDEIFSQMKFSNSQIHKKFLSHTKFNIDSLKNVLRKQGVENRDIVFCINSIDLDDNFELLDFNLHDWSEDTYRVTARLRCKTKIYTDFVKLTYQFYKDNVLVGADYTFVDFVTYGYSGMSPYQTSFLTDYAEKYDFDNILFFISYYEEDGSDDIYWDQLMKLTNVVINKEDNLNHWIGTVENRSNYSFTFPKIFAAIFKNDKMVELDYTYLDLLYAPSDSIKIFSVTAYPTEAEQVSIKNYSNKELQDRFLPHTTATFDSYINLPDEYDRIKYYLNYALYSLEGSGNIPPNFPVFTDTAYSTVERTNFSPSIFLLDHEGDYLNVELNWGDNSAINWSNPILSNSVISFDHSYTESDVYYIIAKAKDDSGGVTEWNDSIKVSISPIENLSIIQKQLKNGEFKKSYDDTIEVMGGIPPYKWQIIDGNLPNGVILNYNTGRIYGSPFESGKYDFIVKVIDNGVPTDADSAEFSLEIFNNPPAIVSSDSISVYEHQQMTYTIRAIDPDSNVIFFNFKNFPSWTEIKNDSSLYGIPPEGAIDTSFLAIASDGELSDSINVNVIVIPVNDPPKITNIEDFSFLNTETYKINLDTCATDPDNTIESLDWIVISADSNLIIDTNNHIVQFSASNWSGTAKVKFVVEDSLEGKDSLSVNVTVNYPSQILLQKDNLPDTYFLGKIYPNPFNSTLSISFGLPEPTNVAIGIYNVIGERVAQLVNGKNYAGYYKINWNANDRPSGIYIIIMKTKKYVKSQKCLLIK
ncbi:MAG: T9SS type A sorting domain-containing protein [Calditrichaeota bacterium]|nr:T9SS type A sorting domain-containing protein [Calditrichota bacterium]